MSRDDFRAAFDGTVRRVVAIADEARLISLGSGDPQLSTVTVAFGALDDPDYWWRLLAGDSERRVMLFAGLAEVNEAHLYRATFDPYSLSDGYGAKSWAAVRTYGKQITAAGARVALLIRSWDLDLMTIARRRDALSLLENAVSEATISPRLWAWK